MGLQWPLACGCVRWGAIGLEPVTPSVSGGLEGPLRPAVDGRVCPLNWADDRPRMTVVVRCNPVVRGPSVARMWPYRPELISTGRSYGQRGLGAMALVTLAADEGVRVDPGSKAARQRTQGRIVQMMPCGTTCPSTPDLQQQAY